MFAILLACAIGFPPIAPAFAANSDSKLPDCCRKDGKHHCSMDGSMGSGVEGPGTAFTGLAAKCPLYPAGSSAPGQNELTVFAPSIPLGLPVAIGPAAASRSFSPPQIDPLRYAHKRGPPAPLL